MERKEEESVDERREGIEESVDERRKRKRREGKRRMWMRREKRRGLGRVIIVTKANVFSSKITSGSVIQKHFGKVLMLPLNQHKNKRCNRPSPVCQVAAQPKVT